MAEEPSIRPIVSFANALLHAGALLLLFLIFVPLNHVVYPGWTPFLTICSWAFLTLGSVVRVFFVRDRVTIYAVLVWVGMGVFLGGYLVGVGYAPGTSSLQTTN